MGFSFDDKYKLIIRPFKDTRTYEYVSKTRRSVINVVNDVKLFYDVSFGNIKDDFFNVSRIFKIPKLKNANFYIECEIEEIEEDDVRAKFTMKTLNVVAKKSYIKPITRAEFAVLESLIHSTRVKVYKDLKIFDELENLLSLIEYYEKLIRRVAPNSMYEIMINRINQRVQEELKHENDKNKNTS